MTSANPNYLPKASPPNTITQDGRVTTQQFEEEAYIQSITDKETDGGIRQEGEKGVCESIVVQIAELLQIQLE